MSTQTAFERATKRVRALGLEINPEDFDRCARELYLKIHLHLDASAGAWLERGRINYSNGMIEEK